jgi:hypothetical protein
MTPVTAAQYYTKIGNHDGKSLYESTDGQWWIVWSTAEGGWFVTQDYSDPFIGKHWLGNDPPGTGSDPNGTYAPQNIFPTTGTITVADG